MLEEHILLYLMVTENAQRSNRYARSLQRAFLLSMPIISKNMIVEIERNNDRKKKNQQNRLP